MSNKQITARDCGIIKPFDQGLLGWLVKVYHDIAAENYVKFQFELYRIHQIKMPENDIGFDGI